MDTEAGAASPAVGKGLSFEFGMAEVGHEIMRQAAGSAAAQAKKTKNR